MARAAALAWCISTGVSEAAARVLSLDLCTDWMLARYAERADVLALSPYIHRYPVAWISADWPTHDGTLERILELKPDLVITGELNALTLRTRLQELGVRVEILPLPRSLSAIADYEARLFDLLGLPADSAHGQAVADGTSRAHGRLLLLGANGIGTGLDTFEHGVIERAGWRNYIQHEGYIALDLERIVSDPPDAVLWAAPDAAALANRFADHPVWRKAVPAEHWLSTDYWRWQCPGPWSWDLVEELAQWSGR